MQPGLNPAGDGDLGQGVDLAELHGGLGLHQGLSGGQDLLVLLHLGPHDQLVLQGARQGGVDVIFQSLPAAGGGPGDWSAVCQAVTGGRVTCSAVRGRGGEGGLLVELSIRSYVLAS